MRFFLSFGCYQWSVSSSVVFFPCVCLTFAKSPEVYLDLFVKATNTISAQSVIQPNRSLTHKLKIIILYLILKPEFGVKCRNCRHRKCKTNEIDLKSRKICLQFAK